MGEGCQSADLLAAGVAREPLPLTLLALLEAEAPLDELVARLAACGLTIDEGSLRAELRRLERQGLLHRRGRAEGERGHRRYRITDEGRRARAELADVHRGWSAGPGTVAGQADAGESPLDAERAALRAEREELERQRSDLLSTVAHELRTPLTLVRTSVGLLLDSDPDPAMRRRLLQNIKQSADRMHGLVTDILDLVRLHSNRAELQWRYLDVGALVRDAAGLMRPLVDQKRQTLSLDLPRPAPRVLGDHRRLEQVLLNLLSNAHKFAPPQAGIRVSVTEDAQSVTIAVADTGPGIPPEVQARLFEQFYTARTSSASHSIGAGLGLPIARGIVAAHGGRIRVESQVGQGSVFYVILPRLVEDGPLRDEVDEDPGGG